MERGVEKMKSMLDSKEVEPAKLFDVLYDDQPAPKEKLPDTGVGQERELVLSSMFIKSPNYGTRCSTVVMVDRSNQVQYSERVYDLTTFDYTVNTFEFTIT